MKAQPSLTQEPERLQKFLAARGVASRRAVEKMIESGAIRVNGKKARLGDKVTTEDVVEIAGKRISTKVHTDILIAFNKPRDVVSTMNTETKEKTLADYDFGVGDERLYPVGRLDRSSHGLILMTNDGALANELTHPRYEHEKEYIVTVDKNILAPVLKRLGNGSIKIDHKNVKPAEVEKIDNTTFRIVLSEGRNRQIRKMCDALGLTVRDLKRIRISNIMLDDLQEGEFSRITFNDKKE